MCLDISRFMPNGHERSVVNVIQSEDTQLTSQLIPIRKGPFPMAMPAPSKAAAISQSRPGSTPPPRHDAVQVRLELDVFENLLNLAKT